ncbi:L-seryl-tRNA(Sec) selenium transferase [Adlercreutzia sp. ZJ141]|uniref:L-seryl-tRNA(Sec) selenium transferase n=1 Tax=Adlercreutzia sp. ZJ141 TaxID=2709406 RepID=UPI0013E9DF95|nr:L-seryl-tRNA(Sec) selenium transferase [Adlercreutzia sp. ZJ141]
MNARTAELLRSLPPVEEVLKNSQVDALSALMPHDILVDCVRSAIDGVRHSILEGTQTSVDAQAIAYAACSRALDNLRPSLRHVINATGVIVHTNLGRSVLAKEAVDAVVEAAQGYSTLEYNTKTMSRGSRHNHVEHLICSLTGAEAALAVNNNAAAVMMVLAEFAAGHEAIVSRGELVEIGGSFRVPDIMALSNAHMVEVGTTNKTHLSDYERAFSNDTAMLLKVHPSNYRMVGFTESVDIRQLRSLADKENARRHAQSDNGAAASVTTPSFAKTISTPDVLVYEDQGSGVFLHLDCFSECAEHTVAESLQAGCDLVSFSGDKLLGGPQAGIIVGSKELIARLKANPLARALRLDKMTLAALEATLRLYLNPQQAMRSIPTLRMLTESANTVKERAQALCNALAGAVASENATFDIVPEIARAGGGSLPMYDIDTFAVRMSLAHGCAQSCEEYLISKNTVPIIGRIKKESVLFDARTIIESDIPEIARACAAYFDTL